MSHLTPDEIVDLLEGTPPDDTMRGHLASCPTCRARIDGLSNILADAKRLPVPEPSLLFWEQLSQRVRLAVTAEPLEAPQRPRWLRWPVLMPVAGLAGLIVAVASVIAPRVGQVTSSPDPGVIVSDAALNDNLDPATVEDTWALVSDLVGPLDLDTAREAGLSTGPGAADEALLQLTALEQEELVRLLQQELKQPGG
jgi:hypothetical protein